MAWDRSTALMSMTTPLGGDALIPTYMVADEEISHPFQFRLQAVSQQGAIAPDDLLNKPVCVILRNDDKPVRHFHGIVQEIADAGTERGATAMDFRLYSLVVRPRLWFLNQTVDCRVYQNKSVKDIVSALFQDAALTDFTWSASGGITPRPYTIQYNESDYHFALRLMEEEGLFYYFEHTAAKHQLIVADKNATFPDIPKANLAFNVNDIDPNGIGEWKTPSGSAHGSFKMRDYDPENPGTKLMADTKTVLKTAGATARDVFRWPAATFAADVVTSRVKFEMEAAEAEVSVYSGSSRFGGLVAGGKFKLANTPASPYDSTYVVRQVSCIVEDNTWIANEGTVSYRNRFEAFKSSVNWRQRMLTPRPRMDGVHTAIVMGPQSSAGGDIKMQSGEEIHTDDLARVKVRFFWDHRAEATGGASVWARVVQPWAGNGWGAQFIPRVGTEVAVAFVDGDPDRPIVIGGLYNGTSAPIYSKADKTKSGFRTRSSLGGKAAKFNELTFDDKIGNELVYIHAEKDMTTHVENDETLKVDNCRIVTVKVDETITVKGKQTIKVDKDHYFEVTQGKSDYKISKGDSTFTVSMGNQTEKISMGNHKLDVDMGNISVKAAMGKIDMEAMQSITLKVGGSSLKIDQMGVTIKGAMKLDMEAGLAATFKSGLQMDIKSGLMLDIKSGLMMNMKSDLMSTFEGGLMGTFKSGVLTTLKGAITMIN